MTASSARQKIQNNQLKCHRQKHARRKPLTCMECGKGFGGSVTLKDNTSRHTGENSFSCKVCGKGFSQQKHLKTRRVTHCR